MCLQFLNSAVIANSKLDYWTVYFVRAVFRFRFIACIDLYSNTKLWWAFYLPPFAFFTKLGFFWQLRSEKRLPTCFVWSFLFCSVFFHGVCKPCHEPETSGDWTHKYHTALVFITRFLYWTFLYVISLIGIFFRYLFVLTYFDSSRRYTNATTHAAGTQIGRTKMTSLDAIFCRGNKSSSRSPARFCRRKHKKSTARASRSWKNLSSTCRQV